MVDNKQIITIGISGASCTGKSTLAGWLQKIFPNSTILHQDDFFKKKEQLPIDPKTNLANGECPEAIDFKSFIDSLYELHTSTSLVKTFKPKKNNHIHNDIESNELDELVKELNDQVQNALSEKGKELNFVLVDGFLLYINSDVVKELDIKLFLKADYDILKSRREIIYGKKRLGRRWVDPPNYFDNVVWPNYYKINKHIIDRTEGVKGDMEDMLNDLIILESNNLSRLSNNIEYVVKTILNFIYIK
ncbi:P-loop containing nucleoside triphosphate hydrolase protein [Glomus cerebriforme]|uniref:P-loop containing nucleoside triphosphate hydrolase protein n=1 Tax=Glomus cerebriforme TaxID=658196 RepID=A0A397SP28_9GLOM|nr:P-loop containing nucleoside triphosphate hydrolase protein [Glomus cerebriforme]